MKITIDIPDEIAQNSTLGTTSQIAGMQQLELQGLLYDRGISLHYGIDDYRADVESLRSNHWR